MKKSIVMTAVAIATTMFAAVSANAQNIGSMEQTNINDRLLLNETEGAYLNNIFETTRKDFEFTNKEVGFLTGSSGKTMSSKKHYFDMHKKYSTNTNSPCDNGTLYIFDAVQKAESGGYDAAIVYWSKFLLPIEDVIKRLRRRMPDCG